MALSDALSGSGLRVSTGAIIRQGSKLLVVKPTYRDYWLLPGGHVEEGETPRAALAREIHEELSIRIVPRALLCIDLWEKGARADGAGGPYVQPDDALVLLFDGGEISSGTADRIRLPADELEDFAFLDVEDALGLLAPYYEGRLRSAVAALGAGRVARLRGGVDLPSG